LRNNQEIENLVREFFNEDARGIVSVYLFGSVARGTAGARSDVDVGVLYPEDPPRTFESLPLGLEGDLERRLGIPTQVVLLNHAPVDLVHRVLRDGKLLLDLDPSRRIRFEVRARNEFFDLQPILEQYRKPPRIAR
jgi:uncharacterized protein